MLDVRIDKLWGMDWWWDHPLAAQPPADWEAQNQVIHEGDAAPTNLFNLGLYYRVTGDEAVVEPARVPRPLPFREGVGGKCAYPPRRVRTGL